MCWGSRSSGKVRNQHIALSKADSPSEEDPEVGVTAVGAWGCEVRVSLHSQAADEIVSLEPVQLAALFQILSSCSEPVLDCFGKGMVSLLDCGRQIASHVSAFRGETTGGC